jgi:hypothetical protein
MKENVKQNLFGQYLDYIINVHVMFMNYSINVELYHVNYMIIYLKKVMQMQILLLNGKNLDLKNYVVSDVFKLVIRILVQLVYVVYQEQI